MSGLALLSVFACLAALLMALKRLAELRDELEKVRRLADRLKAMAEKEELYGFEPDRGTVHIRRGQMRKEAKR